MDDLEVTKPDAQGQPSDFQKTAILWGVIAIGFSILVVMVNTAPAVAKAGFFAKLFGIILGAITGTLGALAGDMIRKFAKPDFMMTSGGMGSIIWMKLFWMAGPQVIGLVIGTIIGNSLILN